MGLIDRSAGLRARSSSSAHTAPHVRPDVLHSDDPLRSRNAALPLPRAFRALRPALVPALGRVPPLRGALARRKAPKAEFPGPNAVKRHLVATLPRAVAWVPRALATVPRVVAGVPRALAAVPCVVARVPRALATVPRVVALERHALAAVPRALANVPRVVAAVPRALAVLWRVVAPVYDEFFALFNAVGWRLCVVLAGCDQVAVKIDTLSNLLWMKGLPERDMHGKRNSSLSPDGLY